MAGISHQNPNGLLRAYCQGLLLHIRAGHWVQLVFEQFYTPVQNRKKMQFNRRFIFLMGGAVEVQDWPGWLQDTRTFSFFLDGWRSKLTLIWAWPWLIQLSSPRRFKGLFRWMNRATGDGSPRCICWKGCHQPKKQGGRWAAHCTVVT